MSAGGDPRFSHVATDPRFKEIPRRARKVQIDSRFQSMFTGDAFKVKYSVDKRGRRVGGTSSEDLCKYYQLPEGVPPADPQKTSLEENGATSQNKRTGTLEEEEEEEEESDEAISCEGEALSDSSSDTDDESGDELEEEEVVHSWGEVGGSVPETRDTSSRLAICNMDWDRITAQDLYVLLNSFKPPGGVIHSVTIFPSDFGLEQMAKEEIEGPGGGGGHGEEGEEGSGFSREKLRQYQMNRLKYFYAVVDCDTEATAESVYEQCDGLEYERSGGRLDLRFIPEGMTFDDREPKSVATELLVPADYQPCDFFSSALQQSKVQLTWDEAEPRRLQTTMRKFTKEDLQSMDFSAYLASSGSDEEEGEEGAEEEEKQIQKYRALLAEGQEKGKKKEEEEEEELEITWEPGLQKGVEELVKKKTALQEASQATPWENYQRERRKKKKERKGGQRSAVEEKGEEEEEEEDVGFDDPFFQHDVTMATAQSQKKKSQKQKMSKLEEKQQQQEKSELELLVMEEEGDEREHFSLKGILKREKEEKRRKKRKRKIPEEEAPGSSFEVDIADPRFSALYESHQFAPDPSHPQYRPTKAMTAIITERRKRGRVKGTTRAEIDGSGTRTIEPSIGALVKSVKSKVGSFSKHHKKQRLKAH